MRSRIRWLIFGLVLLFLIYPVRWTLQKSLIEAFRVPSSSMENTILYGEHILVKKNAYALRAPLTETILKQISLPARKDVVVFRYPGDRKRFLVKRVIALAGEKLEIRERKVYINDKLLDEPYAVFKAEFAGLTAENFGPVVVPKQSYFVMGDNRDNSKDSRAYGSIPLDLILGKAFMVYLSQDPETKRIRSDRIGVRIR